MDQSNNGNRSNTTPAGGASPRKKKKSWIRRILGFFAKLFLVLFTLLVSLFMQKKLHRIDMVESLKAPE